MKDEAKAAEDGNFRLIACLPTISKNVCMHISTKMVCYK